MHAGIDDLTRVARLRQQLRALPSFAPPAQSWAAIEQRLQAPPTSLTSPARDWRWYSQPAAASVLGVLVSALLWFALDRGPGAQAMGVTPAPEVVASLVSRSQQLESVLQELPKRPAVERAATSAAIDVLQTRIQWLDTQLSSVPDQQSDRQQTQQLWSERVRLLTSLVGVRYAEAVRVDHQTTVNDGAI